MAGKSTKNGGNRRPYRLRSLREWLDKNAQYHRVDGPALEWDNGNKEWAIHGLALIFESGRFHTLNQEVYRGEQKLQFVTKQGFRRVNVEDLHGLARRTRK